MDHDGLFKAILQCCFIHAMWLFAPEIARNIDPASVEFVDPEQLPDELQAALRRGDLAVKVRYRGAEGADAYILVHVEAQASPDPTMGQRMFEYGVGLWRRYRLPVYPIVVYSYDVEAHDELEAFDLRFPDGVGLYERFKVIRLRHMSWRDYAETPNAAAAALMSKMRMAPEERPVVKLSCLRTMVSMELTERQRWAIFRFVDAYLNLDPQEQAVFDQKLTETLPPKQREDVMEMMTSTERKGYERGLEQGMAAGREQGLEQGLAAGREQGLEQGERAEARRLVLRQIHRRIGALSDDQRERIDQLTLPQLEALGEALLDFQSPNDLRAWLDSP